MVAAWMLPARLQRPQHPCACHSASSCLCAVQVAGAVADAVGPGRTGIRLSPFSNFLDATDPDTLDLNLYLVEKLSDMGLLYLHCVEPRISGASDAEATDDTLEPLRKAYKVSTLRIEFMPILRK